MKCISLTTDFGLRDEYVGVMKGVILTVCPTATLVDISHDIPPQDVGSAARMLRAAFAFFPKGTIHVAVVDPGVGTRRSILAARLDGHVFLVPNNGLLPAIADPEGISELVQVTEAGYFRHPVSCTFHGRDIFAPVAGQLCGGLPLNRIGLEVSIMDIIRLPESDTPTIAGEQIRGRVRHVDRFGNLISDIPESLILRLLNGLPAHYLTISVSGHVIQGLSSVYADARPGLPVAVIGSRATLEIAVNQGCARAVLNAGDRDEIRVTRVRTGEIQPGHSS